MSATVIDVARRCNVSPGIASRVLSAFQADITEETRNQILHTAQELGYVPSTRGRSLGVLFMDESAKGLTHPFFASILEAFKNAAELRGYDVTFVRQNCNSIGEEAAKRLIGMIEKPGSVPWIPTVVPVELLEGGTVARIEETP